MKSFIKKKVGTNLGFRTPDFVKGSKFSNKGFQGKFTRSSAVILPSQFKTQHKGGGS
ncbi:hypothetical protein HYT60_00595 [Candidatus Woesebacteria bacterium]|nr:hypothetical protein [Candidatus Woesebacteria bacterium]